MYSNLSERSRQTITAGAGQATGRARSRRIKTYLAAGALTAAALAPISAAHADSLQPVYVIAHRCNDVGDVPNVLNAQGVNAIEADFSYGAGIWAVDHSYVLPTSTKLNPWLDDVAAAMAKPGSPLSLIILDIKDPDGPLMELYTAVRAKLGPDINLIFSIADFPARNEFDQLVDALNNDPRAGADIAYLDEGDGETQLMVRDFFQSKGMNKFWYGDGFTAVVATPDSVVTNIDDGMALRDAGSTCESFHGVYTWTYESQSSITEFLDKGVNGIMVNADECHDIVGVGVWEPKDAVSYAKTLPGRKFATRADNPFEHVGVTADVLCGPADLALSRSSFIVMYATSAGRSPDITLPPPATPVPGPFSFNTPDAPFLLPCDVVEFGGQVQATLLSSDFPVYWQGDIRFIHEEGFTIVSHGYSGVSTFDHGVLSVSPILYPGFTAGAGYVPVSSVGAFRDWQYQPSDLPADTPVRMQILLTPFADAQFQQALPDPDPSNNIANLWIKRACTP